MSRQTGWWTALFTPFQAKWTLTNYEAVLGSENMANAFINSLIVTIPADGHPDHHRGLRGLCLRVDALPVPGYALHGRRGPARGAASDGPHPGPELYQTWASSARSWASGWPTPPSACRSRSSCSTTSSASCRVTCSRPPSIDGATHFQMFTKVVLPLSVPALAPSRSSSSCGSGTTCWWPWSSSVRAEERR